MSQSMDVSICVLTHNQPQLLRRCVLSCVEESQRVGVTVEIVVIDNASADGYPERVAALSPAVRVICNEVNLGFAAANNQAIRTSGGRYVLILNDDAVLLEGSLDMMLRKLAAGSRVGAVGPKLLNADGTLQRNFTNRRFPNLRGIICQLLRVEALLEKNLLTRDLLTLSKDPEREGETDHIAAACLLARREALESVGLFDEGFYYSWEDADLCWRLKQAGWRIMYLPDARVMHYGSASFAGLSWLERNTLSFRSMLRYFRKHSSSTKYATVRATLALVTLLRLPALVVYRIWKGEPLRQIWESSVPGSFSLVRTLLVE